MADTLAEVKKIAQRALDVHEVQNLMSKHTYLYEAGMYEEMLGQFARKTPDVTVEIANWGVFEGFEGARKMIVEQWQMFERMHSEGMKKAFPGEITHNRMGMLDTQALGSPVIEVAGDGKTAKGLWSAPSTQTQFSGLLGKPEAAWAWLKFAVDFVKEDGEWKIWHYHLCPLFRTSFNKSWVESSLEPPPAPASEGEDSPSPFKSPKPDRPTTEYYNAYSLTTAPKYIPRPPEPYETFGETFSY